MSKEKHDEGSAATLVRFNFHGDELDVFQTSTSALVSVRRVCEAIGLGYSSQLQKLRGDDSVSVTMIVTQMPGDDQAREIACIDVRALPLWLATVHPNKVSPRIRAKLVDYKREAAEVLANHFLGPRGEIPEELREAAAVLPGLVARVQELEATLATFPQVVSDHPVLGTATARLYILDPLMEIARLKGAAIQKTGHRVIQKLRFATERALRAELGFTLAPAHAWANFPTARLGEACCIIARMRAEAQILVDTVQSARHTQLTMVK